MTDLRRLALGTMMPTFEGLEAPQWLLDLVREGLGAVALFARNIGSAEQLRELVASLRAARADVIIAIDEEAGDVTRLYHGVGSPFPGGRTLGEAGSLKLTRAVGRGVGLELAAFGINLDLAPVADTVSSARSPLGTRSFSGDAASSAQNADAWVQGLQSAGVAACLKHFPGLGASEVDSHLSLARVAVEREDFEKNHLAGFLPALQNGAASVMSAHVIVDALDTEPTTLSPPVQTGLLREQLGFDGVTVSDALEMHGVLDRTGSLPAAAVGALGAGVDLLCLGAVQFEQSTRDCVEAVIAAVDDGSLSMARLVEAGNRVQRMAERFAASDVAPGAGRPGAAGDGEEPATGDETNLGASMAAGEERRAGLAAARRAISAEGEPRGIGESVVVLDDRTSIAAGPVPWGPARELGLLQWSGSVQPMGPGDPMPDRPGVLVVRDLLLHPERDWQVQAMDLSNTVVLDMGLSGREYPGARGVIRTFGASRASSVAALEILTEQDLDTDLLPGRIADTG